MSDFRSTADFPNAQAAYDWASQMFHSGGFKIAENRQAFYLVTSGNFALLGMAKTGARVQR